MRKEHGMERGEKKGEIICRKIKTKHLGCIFYTHQKHFS